jgi:hypothetical protein
MAAANWKQARKDLAAIGVTVNTSLKACCLGCVENSPIPRDVPALYQLSSRFSAKFGGFLSHQNITPEIGLKIVVILNANGVIWEWNGERSKNFFISLGDKN